MASISVSNITSSSFKVTISGLDTNYAYVRHYDWYLNGSYIAHTTSSAGVSSKSYTYGGLTPNTYYTFYVEISGEDPGSGGSSGSGGSVFATLSGSDTTEPAPAVLRPSNWSWTNAIAQDQPITNLTATDWNNFCSRINDFREYKGLSTFNFTTVYSGTTVISASIINEAIVAITAISGHGVIPNSVSTGGTILASIFTSLRDALNAIT